MANNIQKSEFEEKLRFAVKKLSTGKIQAITVVAFILALIAMLRLLEDFKYWYIFIAAGSILISAFVIINKELKKDKLAKNALLNALKSDKKMMYQDAINYLIAAFKYNDSEEIDFLLRSYLKYHKPTVEQEYKLYGFEAKKIKRQIKKDKKLSEIIKQTEKIIAFIKKHKEVIKSVNIKINDLDKNKNLNKDSEMINEYESLIKRYKDIIALENAKIEFYEQTFVKLIRIKENHLNFNKLQIEQQNLYKFENQMLEKSLLEQYDTKAEDFILYEKTYLEALKEYSDSINSIENINLFDEIIKAFEQKTEK